MLRLVFPRDAMLPFIVFIVSLSLKKRGNVRCYAKNKKVNNNITILVLNSFRFPHDLAALKKTGLIRLVELPPFWQNVVNALWLSPIRKQMRDIDPNKKNRIFYAKKNKDIKKCRDELVRYLEKFLPYFLQKNGIDGIMSCSFFYVQDADWQIACANTNIPFFALHKENMQDPVIHKNSIARYRYCNFKFNGQRMFLYNRLAEKVILGANVCNKEVIRIVGACRMDSLYNEIKTLSSNDNEENLITLFSFHHAVGLLQMKGEDKFFSNNQNEGFVQYFDIVHAKIAEFALKHKYIKVFIKPKWGGNWIERIDDAIWRGIGNRINQIDNLIVDFSISAQDLIKRSKVIIGINSTALLEAKLFGKRVIVPLFAEAAGKYYNENVYFKKYQDDVFNVVRNPDKLEKNILLEYNKKLENKAISDEMVRDYLGYFDGQCCKRVVEIMKEDINKIKGNRINA